MIWCLHTYTPHLEICDLSRTTWHGWYPGRASSGAAAMADCVEKKRTACWDGEGLKFLVPQHHLGDPIKIGTPSAFLQVFLGKSIHFWDDKWRDESYLSISFLFIRSARFVEDPENLGILRKLKMEKVFTHLPAGVSFILGWHFRLLGIQYVTSLGNASWHFKIASWVISQKKSRIYVNQFTGISSSCTPTC